MEELSIFTICFNGNLCDCYSRMILRLVGQVDLRIFQEEVLAYTSPHTFQTRLMSRKVCYAGTREGIPELPPVTTTTLPSKPGI